MCWVYVSTILFSGYKFESEASVSTTKNLRLEIEMSKGSLN